MFRQILITSVLLFLFGCNTESNIGTVISQNQWEESIDVSQLIEIQDGNVYMLADTARISSVISCNGSKRKLQSVTVKQLPVWDSWEAIPKLTPAESNDAPVFIPVAKGNYWLLARYIGDNDNGYHAWHSTDMQSWKHYGPVSSYDNRWVTSAEYMDGNFYIYFDKPNDEDPHLIIDDDLTDGIPGREIGRVFNDPSHGSDMAIFRDDDNTFHLIYEDWSPIDARNHSWDSPLAGHSDSPDGINGFEPHEYPPPIDKRSKPTGKIITWEPHPSQVIEGYNTAPHTYEQHEGPQDAFGDYSMIRVGDQYYIFCDYDPHDESKSMRVGRWRSGNIGTAFAWDGEIGEGFHPDPTVGFAEGRFYLIVQRSQYDYISDGPWVDGVEARVGVDTDNDGSFDQWTEFVKIKEQYNQKEGFVKVIEALPAQIETSELESGYAFKVEIRLQRVNGVAPIIESIEANFEVE